MRVFKLTEVQANAILDTRLRSLRKLEEMELKRELTELTKEKAADRGACSARTTGNGRRSPGEIREVRKTFGPDTRARPAPHHLRRGARHLGASISPRRWSSASRSPSIVSQKGWIRALKGHVADLAGVAVQGRRRAQDVVLHRDDRQDPGRRRRTARFFTLDAAKLPGGRGFGDPIRLMVDLDEGADIVAAFPYQAGREAARRELRRARLHRAGGRDRRQHAQGQAGPQRRRARREPWSAPEAAGDHVAIVGENRKLLVFPHQPAARDGPRQGRAPAALQGRRRLRRQGLRPEGRPDLEGHVRPHLDGREAPTCGLDRQPRRGRPPAAEGFSEERTRFG